MTDLSAAVEDARIRLGITQQTLAGELKVSQAHYSKVASETVMHSSALAERMQGWLDEIGGGSSAIMEPRIRALSQSIRKQSRELAFLLASSGRGGALRPVRRSRSKGGDDR